ncbi:hypothetical protein P5G51_004025 [Virgibacillus sp. 179-BFC.A HS]|uniref:DUF4296 domain-containing protein n=1 Tax=Tigheibacillus jepli TaxID=3035914 RepID=A0ABU5CGH6_9BACI|nr:hypothetical protein [Virgibacillus sp. 179-BFC.A HS]MDY0404678.1 hypothetical protein [Virgibacillus sp. 179-BFC.A HS]
MMKKQMKVGLMLMGIFFMTACGPEKTTYQKGFPEQSTPEISQFLQSELIGGEYDYLFTHQETSVYTDHKAIENASYYALQANKLTALYKSLFNNNNPGETFRDLKKRTPKH